MTSDRLRIALVVHDYHRHGGHARYAVELATRFRNHHDVHVFSNTANDPDTAGITFHHVPAWRANALTTIASFILPATLKVRGQFDIVHAQGLCGLRQNVVTVHICQPAWFAAADRYAGRQTWRKQVFRAVVIRLERLVMRPGTTRFIAPSTRVKEDIAAHYGLIDGVRVVYHGTDTEAFHPRNREKWRGLMRAQLGLNPTDIAALYVGDLQKAMPVALRAIVAAPGVKLVAVSKSDPSPFKAQSAALGIADRVTFVPSTAEVAPYYAAADLLFFPTYYDAFGMVITEAMASGLPSVVSQAAGAAELVTQGKSGWLVTEPWDADLLAARVRLLAADAGMRDRMGAAARTAVEAYTWDRTAAETMAVYREVIAGKA